MIDPMIIVWIAVAIVGLVIFLWFFPVTLWFQALISGVHISLIQLVLMRWRGVSPTTIVMAMVTGTKAGLKWADNEVEFFTEDDGQLLDIIPTGNMDGDGHKKNIKNFIDVLTEGAEPVFKPSQGVDMIKIFKPTDTNFISNGDYCVAEHCFCVVAVGSDRIKIFL